MKNSLLQTPRINNSKRNKRSYGHVRLHLLSTSPFGSANPVGNESLYKAYHGHSRGSTFGFVSRKKKITYRFAAFVFARFFATVPFDDNDVVEVKLRRLTWHTILTFVRLTFNDSIKSWLRSLSSSRRPSSNGFSISLLGTNLVVKQQRKCDLQRG